MQQRVLKPEYKAFFLYKTLQLLLIYTAVGIGLTVGIRLSDIGSIWTLPLLGILVVLLIVHIISTKATYNKTEIQLKPKKIVHRTGKLFTNKEVTVTIPKITHLKHTEPFFKQKLFGTSTIQIQAAGTNNAAITLPDIENGSTIFEDIQTTMRENGFSLQRNKVQQKESPDLLRTLLEKGQSILWFTIMPSIIFLTPLYLSFPSFFILTITLVLTLIAVSFYFVYKNTTNTTFILYDDAIEHHNEFFNKHHTILPAENLADVNNNQDLVDRLLSVSNIKITTQGDGSTTYNNIPRGEQIEKHIDNMTKAYKPLLSKNQETPEQKQRVQERTQPQKEQGTTKSYKQNPTRAAIGGFVKGIPIGILIYFFLFSEIGTILGPFALVFFFTTVILTAIGSSIYAYIQAERRTYEVRPTGIRTTYSLIQKTSNEFSDDKLVGIEVTRNPLDRLCGTAKITFQSLSNSPNISFKYIDNWKEITTKLQQKYYLDSPLEKKIDAQYTIPRDLSKNAVLYTSTALILLLSTVALTTLKQYFEPLFGITPSIMLPVTGVILTLFIANTGLKYLAFKDSYLSIHEEHLDYKAGFLLEKRELVRYEDVKNQHSLKYRLTSVGTLHVGIGGSSIKQQENKNTASVPTINAFNATYIPSTHNILDYVDAKIVGMKKGFNKTIQTAQRDVKNDVVLATMLSPLTLLLSLLALPILIIRTKMYRYTIQRDRIVSEHGVWNKAKETVMVKNIDHLSKSQGFINNLASNGNMKIYTLGSQTADMVLANFKQYEEWKRKIEQKHRK